MFCNRLGQVAILVQVACIHPTTPSVDHSVRCPNDATHYAAVILYSVTSQFLSDSKQVLDALEHTQCTNAPFKMTHDSYWLNPSTALCTEESVVHRIALHDNLLLFSLLVFQTA